MLDPEYDATYTADEPLYSEAELEDACASVRDAAYQKGVAEGRGVARRYVKALSECNGSTEAVVAFLCKAVFDEDKHPRDHGQFSSKPGAKGGDKESKPAAKPDAKSAPKLSEEQQAALRELHRLFPEGVGHLLTDTGHVDRDAAFPEEAEQKARIAEHNERYDATEKEIQSLVAKDTAASERVAADQEINDDISKSLDALNIDPDEFPVDGEAKDAIQAYQDAYDAVMEGDLPPDDEGEIDRDEYDIADQRPEADDDPDTFDDQESALQEAADEHEQRLKELAPAVEEHAATVAKASAEWRESTRVLLDTLREAAKDVAALPAEDFHVAAGKGDEESAYHEPYVTELLGMVKAAGEQATRLIGSLTPPKDKVKKAVPPDDTDLHDPDADSPAELLAAAVEYAQVCLANGTDSQPGLDALYERADDGDVIAKAWSEEKHPRDDSGRFVSAKDIRDAARSPKKADELRASVTDPEQRKKLDAALSEGRQPLGGLERAKDAQHFHRSGKHENYPEFHDQEGNEHIDLFRGQLIATVKQHASDYDTGTEDITQQLQRAERNAAVHWREAKAKAIAQFYADFGHLSLEEDQKIATAFDAAEAASRKAYQGVADAADWILYRASNGEGALTDSTDKTRREFGTAVANAKDVYQKQVEAIWKVVGEIRDAHGGKERLGRYFKAWDESKHPRDDSGHFVSKDKLNAAKSDPKQAAELKKRVTDPTERAKLDKVLSGETDPGKTARGQAQHEAGQRRQAKQASRAEAIAIRNRLFTAHQNGEPLNPEDLVSLVPHLSTMTHAELSNVVVFLRGAGANFGGKRLREDRIAKLVEWATEQSSQKTPVDSQGIGGSERGAETNSSPDAATTSGRQGTSQEMAPPPATVPPQPKTKKARGELAKQLQGEWKAARDDLAKRHGTREINDLLTPEQNAAEGKLLEALEVLSSGRERDGTMELGPVTDARYAGYQKMAKDAIATLREPSATDLARSPAPGDTAAPVPTQEEPQVSPTAVAKPVPTLDATRALDTHETIDEQLHPTRAAAEAVARGVEGGGVAKVGKKWLAMKPQAAKALPDLAKIRQELVTQSAKRQLNPRNLGTKPATPAVLNTIQDAIVSAQKKLGLSRPKIADIYGTAKQAHPELTVQDFQHALVQLAKDKRVTLGAWTQSVGSLPDDMVPTAFPLDMENKVYVEPNQPKPYELTAAKPASPSPAPASGVNLADPKALASAVHDAARKVPDFAGNPHTPNAAVPHKPLIGSVYDQMQADGALPPSTTIDEFKRALFNAHVTGDVDLGRISTPEEVTGPLRDQLDRSEHAHGGATWHLVNAPTHEPAPATSAPEAAPQAAVDVADVYSRAGSTATHSEVNAAMKHAAGMPKAEAIAALKKMGYSPAGDPRRQLVELLADRKGGQLRGLSSGAGREVDERNRAAYAPLNNEPLLAPDDVLGAKPVAAPKPGKPVAEPKPAKTVAPAESPATDAGKAVASTYDRAAAATDADIEQARTHLASMPKDELQRVWAAMGMAGKVTAKQVLSRIEERRGTTVRRKLSDRPTEAKPRE